MESSKKSKVKGKKCGVAFNQGKSKRSKVKILESINDNYFNRKFRRLFEEKIKKEFRSQNSEYRRLTIDFRCRMLDTRNNKKRGMLRFEITTKRGDYSMKK